MHRWISRPIWLFTITNVLLAGMLRPAHAQRWYLQTPYTITQTFPAPPSQMRSQIRVFDRKRGTLLVCTAMFPMYPSAGGWVLADEEKDTISCNEGPTPQEVLPEGEYQFAMPFAGSDPGSQYNGAGGINPVPYGTWWMINEINNNILFCTNRGYIETPDDKEAKFGRACITRRLTD